MADRIPSTEPVDPTHRKMARRMSGAQRISAAGELLQGIQRMVRAHLASRHPDWTPQRLDQEIAKRTSGDHR